MRDGEGKWLKRTGVSTEEYEFVADSAPHSQVRHIADWIYAAMLNKEYWLDKLDEQNRPIPLVQIGTLEQAIQKANKSMAKSSQRMVGKLGADAPQTDNIDDFEEIHRFEDGFSLVRLKTPHALDIEQTMMHNCIGDGVYGAKVLGNKWRYYSLRDSDGKSCTKQPLATS